MRTPKVFSRPCSSRIAGEEQDRVAGGDREVELQVQVRAEERRGAEVDARGHRDLAEHVEPAGEPGPGRRPYAAGRVGAPRSRGRRRSDRPSRPRPSPGRRTGSSGRRATQPQMITAGPPVFMPNTYRVRQPDRTEMIVKETAKLENADIGGRGPGCSRAGRGVPRRRVRWSASSVCAHSLWRHLSCPQRFPAGGMTCAQASGQKMPAWPGTARTRSAPRTTRSGARADGCRTGPFDQVRAAAGHCVRAVQPSPRSAVALPARLVVAAAEGTAGGRCPPPRWSSRRPYGRSWPPERKPPDGRSSRRSRLNGRSLPRWPPDGRSSRRKPAARRRTVVTTVAVEAATDGRSSRRSKDGRHGRRHGRRHGGSHRGRTVVTTLERPPRSPPRSSRRSRLKPPTVVVTAVTVDRRRTVVTTEATTDGRHDGRRNATTVAATVVTTVDGTATTVAADGRHDGRRSKPPRRSSRRSRRS